jgi:hypothetical protein
VRHANELSLPDEITAFDDAHEVLRAWVAGGKQYVVLDGILWEPELWGRFASDLLKHIARMLTLNGAGERDEILARIQDGFGDEWFAPTDSIEGDLFDERGRIPSSGKAD